jgi:hypothetical protein
MADIVNEGSAAFFTFTFTDEAGDPVVPITVDWRLDDITDGDHTPTQIADWASLTPASSVSLTSPGSNQDILDSTHNREERVLTVRIDEGQNTQAYEKHYFRVKNLHGAP